jgi:hypothetical protein
MGGGEKRDTPRIHMVQCIAPEPYYGSRQLSAAAEIASATVLTRKGRCRCSLGLVRGKGEGDRRERERETERAIDTCY